MLALDVNLLTTKLQNQSLEEGQTATTTAGNIKLINPETGYKLSESAQAKLGAAGQGKKLWTVSINNSDASKADVAGSDDAASSPSTTVTTPPASTALTKVLCSHKKPYNACGLCDTNSGPAVGGTPVHSGERPKKRHSRSMSVPQETEISIPPPKSTWQPQGSGLWKPVATAAGFTHGCERKWDVRSVHWSPTDCRSYQFSSIAPSMQRHLATGHITPDDLVTPPESPVPRPNSVYSDGAISPFTGDPCMDYANKLYHISEFRNRSLSVEDKISCCSVTSCDGMGGGSSATTVAGSGGLAGSMPSSPHHRYRIPRCRSQPSFYDRKSGRRRRRDCRPTLNFNKMTETAYGLQLKSTHLASPGKDQVRGSCFHDDLEHVMGLMPIASSPRETADIPNPLSGPHCTPTPTHTHTNNAQVPGGMNHINRGGNSPIHELECMNRGDDGSTYNRGVSITEEDGSSGTSVASTPRPVKLLGEEEEEDENGMEVFQFTEELDLEQIENH